MIEELVAYLPAIITAVLSGIAAKIINGCKEKLLNFETKKDKQIEVLKQDLTTLTQGLTTAREDNGSIVNSLDSVNANMDDLQAVVGSLIAATARQAEEIKELTDTISKLHADNADLAAAIRKE